ncbi:hypothetical protein H1C71_001755, partial [Ictidomys tridecemlineatus]
VGGSGRPSDQQRQGPGGRRSPTRSTAVPASPEPPFDAATGVIASHPFCRPCSPGSPPSPPARRRSCSSVTLRLPPASASASSGTPGTSPGHLVEGVSAAGRGGQHSPSPCSATCLLVSEDLV